MMPKKKMRGGEKEKTQLKKSAATVKRRYCLKIKKKRAGRSESMEPVAKRGVTMLLLNSFGKR